jgi:hypothetical protein
MICGEGVVIDEIAMVKSVRSSEMYEFFGHSKVVKLQVYSGLYSE